MKILIRIFRTILLCNVVFGLSILFHLPPAEKLYEDGIIIKVGPIAMVFCHSKWITKEGIASHMSYIGNDTFETRNLVEKLHEDGVTYVWGSWCYAEDYGEVLWIDLASGEKKFWPSYVSRGGSGITVPIWVGLWFVRFNFEHSPDIDTARYEWFNVSIIPKDRSGEFSGFTVDDSSSVVREVKGKYNFTADSIKFFHDYFPVRKITQQKLLFFNLIQLIRENVVYVYALLWKRGQSFITTVKILPMLEKTVARL